MWIASTTSLKFVVATPLTPIITSPGRTGCGLLTEAGFVDPSGMGFSRATTAPPVVDVDVEAVVLERSNPIP